MNFVFFDLLKLLLGSNGCKKFIPISPLPKKPNRGVLGKSFRNTADSTLSLLLWNALPLPKQANMKANVVSMGRLQSLSLHSSLSMFFSLLTSSLMMTEATCTLDPHNAMQWIWVSGSLQKNSNSYQMYVNMSNLPKSSNSCNMYLRRKKITLKTVRD